MKKLFYALFLILFTSISQTKASNIHDIGTLSIDSPSVGFCGSNQNILVKIANYGNIKVDSFMLNWSINGTLQSPIKAIMSIDTVGSSAGNIGLINLANHSFKIGVTTVIKVWTSLPNNFTDSNSINDTSTITRTLTSMSGIYTVNPLITGPNNFNTLDDAISALNTYGICGPTIVNIAPGTYNRTTTLTLGNVVGTSSLNKLIITNGGQDSCKIVGSISGAALFVLNQSKYVTLRDISIFNNALTNPIALAVVGATNKVSIIKCNLMVPVVTGTSEIGYGLNFTGSTNGAGLTSAQVDSALVDSNNVIGGGYGISIAGNLSSLNNRNIIIRNNNIEKTNSIGIYIANIFNAVEVTQNRILMNSSSFIARGIYFNNNTNSSNKPHIISQNMINHFVIAGIQCINHITIGSSASPTIISNNLVRGYNSNSSPSINGISISTGSGDFGIKVYHNTVVVRNNVVGTAPFNETMGALNLSGSTTADIKNNIFVSTGGTTVLPVLISSNLLANYLNYNVYFNSTIGGNLVKRNSTLYNNSNFLSQSTGGDSSTNVYPAFVDTSSLKSNYSLKHGCYFSSALNNFVQKDISNSNRSIKPTVGAYEYLSQSDNISILDIITPSNNARPISQGLQDVKFRVINAGNNSVNSYQAAYKIGNNPHVSINRVKLLDACLIDTIVFTGLNRANIKQNQDITYYTYNPNSNFDSDPTGDTIKTTVSASLRGTYTIGGVNPDFSTPQEAISKLMELGVSGHVSFQIRAGTYNGPIQLSGPIMGLSDTARITFDGSNSDSVFLSASTNSAVVLINQISFITLRNLTITNSLPRVGLAICSPISSPVTSCNIIKCTVKLPVQTGFGNFGNGILITGSTSLSVTASAANSILIDSCRLDGGGNGIVFTGCSDTLRNSNVIVKNTNIDRCSNIGLTISNVYNPVNLEANQINMLAIGSNYGVTGISFTENRNFNKNNSHRITRNKVFNFKTYGMYFTNTSQVSDATTFIANNEIISSPSVSVISGIYIVQAFNNAPTVIAHNTVYLVGKNTSTSNGAVMVLTSNITSIYNNIFYVNSGGYYPLYMTGTQTNNLVNQNLYFNKTSSNLVYRAASIFTSSNYKTASGGGIASFNLQPSFISTDSINYSLGLVHKCFYSILRSSQINVDIYNNTRDSITAVGAYESFKLTNSISLENIISPSTTFSKIGVTDVQFLVRNVGTNLVSQYQAGYIFNNGIPVTNTKTVNLEPCSVDTFTASSSINLKIANNFLKTFIYSPNNLLDVMRLDDSLSYDYLPRLSGTFTIGAQSADFNSVQQAMSMAISRGISGHVSFMLQPGTYSGTISLSGTVPGISSNSSITFDGGNVNLVSFIADTVGAVFAINQMRYIRLRNITFINRKVGTGVLINGSISGATETGCEIRNCRIILPADKQLSNVGFGINITRVFNNSFLSNLSDSITIDSNYISGGANSIAFKGGSNNIYNRKIEITNNVIDSCNTIGIGLSNLYNPVLISGNVINMNARDSLCNGINFSDNLIANGKHIIDRNKIYNFGSTGILCARNSSNIQSNLFITNNIVISADSISGNRSGITGIYLDQTGQYNASVLHNTVLMRGNPVGYIPSCIDVRGSQLIKIYNNIFAVYKGSYTPLIVSNNTPYQGNINANIYFIKNASPTRNLLVSGGSFNSTNYAQYYSGGTSSSNADPLFRDITNPTPDLSLLKGCVVSCYLMDGTGSFDFFGKPRSVFPTVGAIERISQNLSINPLLPFSLPVTTGLQDLKFLIQNTSTDTITSYNGSYTHNNNNPVTINKSKQLNPCEIDTISFTGSLRPNLVPINNFKIFTGLSNSYTGDDTIAKVIYTALAGSYSIGINGGYFNSFKEATSALESGIVGAVKFQVQPGTYNERLIIEGPINGADSIRTISFEGTDPSNTVLSFDSNAVTASISNVPYISFYKLGFLSSIGGGISFQDKYPTPRTSNIKVSNCNITTQANSALNGITIGNVVASFYDSLTIDSNKINNADYAIYVKGVKNRNSNKSTVLRNNIIENCGGVGISVTDLFNKVEIINNSVSLAGLTSATTDGISLYYVTDGSFPSLTHNNLIMNNRIYNFRGSGINATVTGNYNKSGVSIINNSVISAKDGFNYSTGQFGINVWVSAFGTLGANVFHNSVVMQGLSTNLYHAALKVDASDFNVRNNILAVYSGSYIPLYLTQSVSLPSSVNHNLYYNNSSILPRRLVNSLDSSNFKNNTGGDSSFTMAPPFVNREYFPSNLALTDQCFLNRGSNLLSLVPKDINNITRPISPTVGAFEFLPLSNNVSVKSIIAPIDNDSFPTGSHDVKFRVINAGTNNVNQYTANYKNNNGVVYSKLRNVNLAPCMIDTVEFNALEKVKLGLTNILTTFTSNPNGISDSDKLGDTTRLVLTPLMVGDYTIGGNLSDFLTIKDANNRLKRGVGGAVRFKIKSGAYQEYVNLSNIKGTSAKNTITFTSFDGNADSVLIFQKYSISSTLGSSLVLFDTDAKYYILDKLTLQTDGIAASYSIQLSNSASFDTIRNCVIKQPLATGPISSYYTTNIYANSYVGDGVCFIRNKISGGYYCISLQGVSRNAPMKNVIIDSNEFSNSYALMGWFRYGKFGSFSNNTIIQGASSSSYSISMIQIDSGFRIISNTFIGIPGKDISVTIDNSRNDFNKPCIIGNNKLTGGNVWLSLNNNLLSVDLVHNTVSGTNGNIGFSMNNYQNVRSLNNISTGTSTFYSSNFAGLTSDYNSSQSYVVNGTNYTPLQFKTTFKPVEANSVNTAPGLISLTNLAPDTLNSASWSLNGTGTHIGYSLNDINNAPRPQTFSDGAPDIGAQEFTPIATPTALTIVNTSTTSAVFLQGIDTIAKIKWVGTIPISNLTGKLYTGTYPPGITSNLHKSLNMYWDFNAPIGSYNYELSLYYRYPCRGTIPAILNMIGAQKTGANPWAFYQGNAITIDSANNILTIKGLTNFSTFTGTDLSNPLPVKLINFKARLIDNYTLLEWTTVEEKNVSHFEIYTSNNGTDFTKIIDNVKAKGNASSNMLYKYMDQNPFANEEVRYYRLNIVDDNGTYSWSNTEVVTNQTMSYNDLSIYPNPFNNDVTIYTNNNSLTEVLLFDISGRMLYEKTFIPNKNEINLSEISGLNAGVYLITIKQGDKVYTKKLIKN